MRKNQRGFTLIEILIALAVLIITAAGVVTLPPVRQVWREKLPSTPTSTPTIIIPTPRTKTSPIPTKQTKMPWEDSVCGNGTCERCESRSECCNYPCVTDPISGNQMCPPPTCLGGCPQDCQEERGCIGQLRANWQCPKNKWLKVQEGQRCCGDPSPPNLVCCVD